MRVRSTAAALAIAAAALALAACGGSSDSGSASSGASTPTTSAPSANDHLTDGLSGVNLEAATAVQTYLAAREHGDSGTVCNLTSSESPKALAHCKAALAALGPQHIDTYKIVTETVNGDKATLILKPKKGRNVIFKLTKTGGAWKVDVFAFAP